MKVLRVISSVNPTEGGPIEGVKQFQGPLMALGIHVEIACCDPPDASWLSDSALPIVHALGPSSLGYRFTPRLIPWLRDNAASFDAVIVEGIWQYHSFAVWRALKHSGTPYFVYTHGMLGPWFKHTYPLKHLKKWIYWPWGEYRVLRDAKAVLFTCEEERILARESFWLYCAREVVTGFGTSKPPDNGAELSRLFLQNYPSLKGKRIILFLGRIHEVKGCDLIIDAFAQISKMDKTLHLVMAGPDVTELSSSLKIRAESLGISKFISWTGMLNSDAKWGAINLAEVFCLPSHHENFGIVVVEALACGKPVLISNKVNIHRTITSEAAGFVDEDSVDGTVRNMQRWLAMSVEEYAATSLRASICFAQNFDIEIAAKNLISVIGKTEN